VESTGEHVNAQLIRRLYEIRNGRITEAWLYPEDPEEARRFFE
jgi:hypothetical protein